MLIDRHLCVGCGACQDYCPMAAIRVNEVAFIDPDECVECGVCKRAGVCPTEAIKRERLSYPRDIASFFSDPSASHPSTGIPGRGTEEMKTNEVTGRFKRGWAGVAVEVGRPGVGTRFVDVEKVARSVAGIPGVEFEPINPVTALMIDKSTGSIRPELHNLKVMSAIVEFAIPQDRLAEVLAALHGVAAELNSVFSLDVAARCNADGSSPVASIIVASPFTARPNGKTNVGLGRPLAAEEPLASDSAAMCGASAEPNTCCNCCGVETSRGGCAR